MSQVVDATGVEEALIIKWIKKDGCSSFIFQTSVIRVKNVGQRFGKDGYVPSVLAAFKKR